MMNTIKADFAAAIQQETGAVVEFTMINTNQFSIFSVDGVGFRAAVAMVQMVPGVEMEEIVTFDDGESCAFFQVK